MKASLLLLGTLLLLLVSGVCGDRDGGGGGHARLDPKNPRVEDRLAIEDLISHYVMLIDEKRFDELEEIFTKDAVIDYTADGKQLGGGKKGDVKTMIAWLKGALGTWFPHTLHVASNIIIDFDPRDERKAYVRAKLYNPMCMIGFPICPMFTIMGTYHHDMVKDEHGVWRSASLRETEIYNDALERVVLVLVATGFLVRFAMTRMRS